jgi:hypothetical protein
LLLSKVHNARIEMRAEYVRLDDSFKLSCLGMPSSDDMPVRDEIVLSAALPYEGGRRHAEWPPIRALFNGNGG